MTPDELATAKAQGAADERAEILGLLADEATVKAVHDGVHGWQNSPVVIIRHALAAARVLIAERGAS